jgi:hypothetical protein
MKIVELMAETFGPPQAIGSLDDGPFRDDFSASVCSSFQRMSAKCLGRFEIRPRSNWDTLPHSRTPPGLW